MSTFDKISVIVPVYNAEKYLNSCIDSLLGQTYSNIEIILVDDGSFDTSGEICDLYALKNECIHVIHKENGGVSSARNEGIANAALNLWRMGNLYCWKKTLKGLITNLKE